MKGRLAIFATIVLMVVVLVALNAASYVRVEQQGDTEFDPDRSTFNSGGTGTRALYEYLRRTGRDVVRWRRSPSDLPIQGDEGNVGEASPSTFVVVGKLRNEFVRRDSEALLRWVERGGRLVVVDRSPDPEILPTSGRWRVGSELFDVPGPFVRADDAEDVTRGVELVDPAQPTALTRDVSGVARSRFAARLHVYQVDAPSAVYYSAPRVGFGRAPTPEEKSHRDDDDE